MSKNTQTVESRTPILTLLEQISPFSTLSPARRQELALAGIVSFPPKGKILFLYDDPAPFFYLIKTGWVKLFRETLDGAQAVTDIITGGHLMAEMAPFEQDRYPYSAEVVEAAEIIAFPLSFLKKELSQNPPFTLSFLQNLAHVRARLDHEIEHRVLQNAPQRIGCFLLRLCDQTRSGPQTIHLPYDKTLVAARLGMQPETFSRALTKLREETHIRINGATIEITCQEQLSAYTCAACSSEFPCRDLMRS